MGLECVMTWIDCRHRDTLDADRTDSMDTQIFSPSKTQMGTDISLPESQIGTYNTDRLKRGGLYTPPRIPHGLRSPSESVCTLHKN